ncbi:endoribonuclease Dcr-1 [Galendromus occidentalis]|uniref:Endoribonuclease Dcr-1 n=1 Tax=Galendromus occidentalis TaxID=34638 RepID=A0AAJ6VVK7_9ACAR|nr:endoribonuclease Dcr-1 [Galendromus occidentalis]
MAVPILYVAAVLTACLLVHVDGQSLVTRKFPHNMKVTGALPKNLRLDPALKSMLELRAPAGFEAEVLMGGYKFNDTDHLIKALLHDSYKAKVAKTLKESYQPLDQIGTMVLDYMFMRHILLNMNSISGHQLSTMKNAMVQRDTLCFVALKHNFEKYIHVDRKLLETKAMGEFRDAVEKNEVYQDIVQKIPIPKERPVPVSFLAPMFKAVIGAVYVDSGYDMQAVEESILPLFKKKLIASSARSLSGTRKSCEAYENPANSSSWSFDPSVTE